MTELIEYTSTMAFEYEISEFRDLNYERYHPFRCL